MDERPPRTRSVQQDQHAAPDAETRGETVARVAGHEEAARRHSGGSLDPSTRRGLNRSMWRTLLIAGAIGFVVGALAGLILSVAPGPLDVDGVGSTLWYMFGLGAAVAVTTATVFALITSAREDGRAERKVEEKTGRGPEGFGRPSSPDTDLPPR